MAIALLTAVSYCRRVSIAQQSSATSPLIRQEFTGPGLRTRIITTLARPVARPVVELASVLARPWNARLGALTDYTGLTHRLPPGTSCRRVHLANLDLDWVWHSAMASPDEASAALLYFHGGAFAAGGLRTFRGLAARLSAASGMPVCLVGYRMLPEPIAAAVADGVDAFAYLLDRGFTADRIVVGGDSSGGYLAFAVPLAARARGLPLPGAVVAISPWTDFDCAAKFGSPHRRTEVFFTPAAVQRLVRRFVHDEQRGLRADSPVDADLRGFPPVLIQASTTELLRCDAELMAARLAAAGAPCRLQLWEGQPHGFPVFAALPESRAAITEIAHFVRQLPMLAPGTD